MEHDLNILHNRKNDHFEPYDVLLTITTNIAVLLMTSLCSRDTYIIFRAMFNHFELKVVSRCRE